MAGHPQNRWSVSLGRWGGVSVRLHILLMLFIGLTLIAGFANVDTWIRSVQGLPPFDGTSAATPHVSGAAALVWGANACLSAVQVASVLFSRAADSGTPGYDHQYGAGILYLGPPTTDLCSRVGQLGGGRR
jgi:subtilisin family serine protease